MVGVWERNLGRVGGRWSEEAVLAAISVTAGGLNKEKSALTKGEWATYKIP